MTWEDITVAKYREMYDYLNDEDTNKLTNIEESIGILSIITDKSEDYFYDLPISELTNEIKSIDFTFSTPQPSEIKGKYIINGRAYDLNTDIAGMLISQYIDFQNLITDTTKNLNRIVGIFLIPRGHKYNDGYDMGQVYADMDDLPITDANAIAFFLTRAWRALMNSTASCALKEMRKEMTKIKNPTKRKMIIEAMRTAINGYA